MPISLNGSIVESTAFNWLNDSGFRYGFGCFETMRCINGNVPLLNYHHQRLTSSLADLGIQFKTSLDDLTTFIHQLFMNDPSNDSVMVCHAFVSGGNIKIQPGLSAASTLVLSLSKLPAQTINNDISFQHVTPHTFYRMKGLNYAHHIQELTKATGWPIYLDEQLHVIDGSIFAIGIVKDGAIIFADHPDQCPSVSKQYVLDQGIGRVKKLHKNDILAADACFGCNALRGVVPLKTSECHPTLTSSVIPLFDDLWT